jgi:putative acetyltransferase
VSLSIAREAADTPEATALLTARDAESDALYPPEVQFRIPISEHVSDDVLFFMLREDGVAIGCGALARYDGYGEMKSVYLTPSARGRRLALVIIEALEDVAASLGYDEVRLETGNLSPWAVKTYERAGYSHCGRFGDYPENDSSVFMLKRLRPADGSPLFATD